MNAAQINGDGIVLRVIVGTPEYAAATLGGTWIAANAGEVSPGLLFLDGEFYWPWVGSTHAQDSYALGAKRHFNGVVWENITPWNAHAPGVTGLSAITDTNLSVGSSFQVRAFQKLGTLPDPLAGTGASNNRAKILVGLAVT